MEAEVDFDAFLAAGNEDAVLVDVREDFEYAAGHVPGARSLPLGEMPGQLHTLPTKRPVYVICATGNRSLSAAKYMRRAGINAWSVAGGTKGWQVSGRPVVTGARSI